MMRDPKYTLLQNIMMGGRSRGNGELGERVYLGSETSGNGPAAASINYSIQKQTETLIQN